MSKTTTYMQMEPAEAAAFLASVTRARRLVEAADRFVQDSADPPKPDSALAIAHARNQREAFDIAAMLLYSAQDHLKSIVTLCSPINERIAVPSFALFTLLRSAAEATVRARHLLDLSLTHEQRLARSLNERLMNLKEQGKLVASASDLQARIRRLERRANAVGITPIRDRNRNILAFGERQLTMADLFTRYLKGGITAWRVLSAYAHSMHWLLARRDRAKPSEDPQMAIVSTEAESAHLLPIMAAVLEVFDDAARSWIVLAGFPAEVWTLASAPTDES